MSGLLYKDFIAVKGKKILVIILAVTLIFLVMRLALPGSDLKEIATGTASFEDGIYDIFLWIFPLLGAVVLFGLPSTLIKGLIGEDEKSKIRAFEKALPYGKNTYIASKYIFLAVMVYSALSVALIWCEIYFSRAGSNGFTDLVKMLQSFLIIMASISLLVAGIELPFFLSLGSKKATGVKTAIMEIAFLFVIGWMFFGDLDVFEKFDLIALVEWTKTHESDINVMIVLCPVISSVLYFLSYELTCAINKNREADIDG